MGNRICVVGGGPAGMIAAGTAAMYGAEVTLFEANDRLGKKLSITGKGRCNVTNFCSVQEFMENVTKNSRFLYSALGALSPEETYSFFEGLGVKLKVERGNRVFPESDKAKTIVDALVAYCSSATVVNRKVRGIRRDNGTFIVRTDKEEIFDSVIIATGGRSYPQTGSDGNGYRLAAKLGHTVTPLVPSLIPLTSKDPLCSSLQGLSLKNVDIKITDLKNKVLYTDFGEMMFTHFGVTGPMILSASAHLRNRDISELTLHIDLKPALDEKTLDTRLLNDFKAYANKDFVNSLSSLLPSKLIEPFVKLTGIDGRRKVNGITKEERRTILTTLKDIQIPLSGTRPIEEAIVTSGGIEVSEVNPGSMESRRTENLYFAGEILDLDAYTGGFNLQIAFSTGFLAGKSAAEKLIGDF